MRISELERRTGISRHTIRYYEQARLISNVQRSVNNYRDYGEAVVADLLLLKNLKSFGFTLEEIKSVLTAMRSGGVDCAAGARILREKRIRVEEQVQALQNVRNALYQEEQRLEKSARQTRLQVNQR